MFNSQKTIFTHFTRTLSKAKSKEVPELLIILGATVAPSSSMKVLGVILDQKLNYKEHIARASKKEVNTAMALKRPENLRPETAQQLFQPKIIPVIDYSSTIWSPGVSLGLIYQLNVPQKIAGQAIIGAFCTAASVIVESEARFEPPVIRHHRQQLLAWIKWYTKPLKHRFWKVLSALNLVSTQLILPLQKLAIKFQP